MTSDPSSAPCIVVVDDDDKLRAALAIALERRTRRLVKSFGCGHAALAELRVQPLVALLDVDMFPMPGIELAVELRRRWPVLPLVFLTGCGPERRAALTLLRPHAILRKPADTETLVQTVEAAYLDPPRACKA